MIINSEVYEDLSPILGHKLLELFKECHVDTSNWMIDLSEIQDEGFSYLNNGIHYSEVSDVTLRNIKTGKEISIWTSFAWLKDEMVEPLVFISSKLDSDKLKLISDQTDSDILPPDKYLEKRLGKALYQKLLEQPYFTQGRHMILWN